MTHDRYEDGFIREILTGTHTIAMVGASANPARPSYFAMKYLLGKGFRVFPVNPGLAGQSLLGQPAFARLSEVPEPIDMVDVFRSSEAAGAVVEEALQLAPLPRVIWMQLGVRNDEAAARAEAAGIRVVMNRCPKIEFGRLSGEIGWAGVNSRTLSARRPQRQGTGFQSLGLNTRRNVD